MNCRGKGRNIGIFTDKSIDSQFHQLQDGLLVVVGGNDQHLDIGATLFEKTDHLYAVTVGKHQIQQHKVKVLILFQLLLRLMHGTGFRHNPALGIPIQRHGHAHARQYLILH